MSAKQRRNVQRKQIKDLDTPKKKRCLGPDCNKLILATRSVRLCPYCRKKISEIESESGFFIEGSGPSKEE